ncbi:MAG: hypothetical protein PHY69_08795, partial [Dysgonamonadaceae bacterium]|nr:hypothetical protein [Dysgonamonadaceae bacterium]
MLPYPSMTYNNAFLFTDGVDVETEYIYDAVGNLKNDYYKKIVDIRYNSLNLPDGLQFTNGNTIMCTYDATGNKLSVTHQTAEAGITIIILLAVCLEKVQTSKRNPINIMAKSLMAC